MGCVKVFNSTDSTANEIGKAEESLLLFLYGETNYNFSLDNLRYILFQKSLKKMFQPSWSPCHQHLPVKLSIHSAPTTKSRFAAATKSLFLNNGVGCGETVFFNLLKGVKTTLEPAHDSILQLNSCDCKRNCSTWQFTYLKRVVKCSATCKVFKGTTCQNHNYEDSPLSGNDEDTHVMHLHQVDDSTDSECEYD